MRVALVSIMLQSIMRGRASDNPLFYMHEPVVDIDIFYQSQETTDRIPRCVNPTIQLKTLVMLILGPHQNLSPKNFSIFHVDKHGQTIGQLHLEHSGRKTLNHVGIESGDTIRIIDAGIIQVARQTKNTAAAKPGTRKLKKKTKKNSTAGKENEHHSRALTVSLLKPGTNSKKQNKSRYVDYSFNDNTDRLDHSRKLTLVFEEAYELFSQQRQRLNELVLEKPKPKEKSTGGREKTITSQHSNHNGLVEIQSKAGNPVYRVIVGSEEFLYKSTKKSRHDEHTKPLIIDLHGSTKEGALEKLNIELPKWIGKAMEEHPWTVRVDIVTGCGCQVLADVVEQWIHEKKTVAKRFQ